MTGTSALLGNQSFGARVSVGFQQALDLTDAEVQLLGGMTLFDSTLIELT